MITRRKRWWGPAILVFLVAAVVAEDTAANSNPDNPEKDGGKEKMVLWNGVDYDYGMFNQDEPGKNGTGGGSQNGTQEGAGDKKEDYDHYSDYSWEGGDDSSEEDTDGDLWPAGPVYIFPKYKNKSEEMSPIKAAVTPEKKGATTKVPVITVGGGPAKPEGSQKEYEWDIESYYEEEEDDHVIDDENWNAGNNLPSDNDPDSEKYFDPDRYQDKITWHQVTNEAMGIWTVNYPDTQLPCIMLRGNIQMIVPVNPTWFNRDFVEIDVPQEAEARGTCVVPGNDYQSITLYWNVTVSEKVYQNLVTFDFATNWTSEYSELQISEDSYALVAVTVVYYNGEIGNGDEGIVSREVKDLVEYLTPRNLSMSCEKDQELLVDGVQLSMSNMQMEAFRPNLETLTVGEFATSVLCSSDEVIVFDAVVTYVIWFWIGALVIIFAVIGVIMAVGYRRRQLLQGDSGFDYKVLTA